MRSSIIAGLSALLLSTACDQLSATMQGVSVLTTTPDLANAEGLDDQLATVLPFGSIGMPAATLAAVGVAQKESVTSTAAPTPITGAKVTIAWADQQVKVCEKADAAGAYAATSVPLDPCASPTLAYVEGTKYVTSIETGTDVYTINVTPPAAVNATAVTFSPQFATGTNVYGAVLPSHARGTDLKVDWSADPDAKKRHAFAVVARLNFVGDTANPAAALDAASWQADANNPVFDNTPRKPSEMIDLIINSPVPNTTVPGDNLNTTGLYVLVLTTTEVSTSVSSNLALGSGGLAGAGIAFVFWVD